MPYEIIRFPYDGTIDADGHVLEPAWLWEEYLEAAHRPRAIRIRVDADGLEYLELGRARPPSAPRSGALGLMGAMGDPTARPGPERRYMDHIPFGAGDAKRARRAARPGEPREGGALPDDRPALGVRGRRSRADARLPARLQPLDRRLLPRLGRAAGADRAPLAARSGRRGRASSSARCATAAAAASSARSRTRRSRTAIPITTRSSRRPASSTCRSRSIRPSSRSWAVPVRFHGLGRASEFFYNVMLRQGVQQAFLSFFALGTLERFPTPAARRARVGLRLDRRLPRPHGRGGRDGVGPRRPARPPPERALPPPVLHLGRPGRDGARRTSSTTSAPTASCGRPTTRTPTTRHAGRPRSSASWRRSRRRRARSCSARTCAACTGSAREGGGGRTALVSGASRGPRPRARARAGAARLRRARERCATCARARVSPRRRAARREAHPRAGARRDEARDDRAARAAARAREQRRRRDGVPARRARAAGRLARGVRDERVRSGRAHAARDPGAARARAAARS